MDGLLRRGVRTEVLAILRWQREGCEMIRALAVLLMVAVTSIALTPCAHAQVPVQINSLSTPLSQNFDGMGNSASAFMPSGWTWGTASSYTSSHIHTEQSGGTSGEGV